MYFVAKPNTDAFNFLDAAGITRTDNNSAIIIGIANLTTDLKNYGLWDKMKAIYPMVGGNSGSHSLNLKDPRNSDSAYRLVFSGSWSHTTTGARATSNSGSSGPGDGWADTFMPFSTLNMSSYHWSYYSTQTALNTSEYTFLAVNIDSLFDVYSNNKYYAGSNGFIDMVGGTFNAFHLLNRPTNTFFNVFRNSTKVNTLVSGPPSSTSTKISLGVIKNINYGWNPLNCAFASIGDGLTDTEAANFYTAVQRFQTTLGRQV